MPSKRERALRGLRALKVLRDFMAPSSEYPSALATKLIRDTCNTANKKKKQPFLMRRRATVVFTKVPPATYINNEEVQPAPSICEVLGKSIGHPLQ